MSTQLHSNIVSGELPIAIALSNVVTSNQMDELARVFVTLFDAKHLLSPLLWNMFYREVEVSDCMQTLFRGNSLGSKIMAFCFKIYGATFLQGLLEPLIQVKYYSSVVQFNAMTQHVLSSSSIYILRFKNTSNLESITIYNATTRNLPYVHHEYNFFHLFINITFIILCACRT